MAQVFLLLFGSAFLVLSSSQKMSPKCLELYKRKTNGCSVPLGAWVPYKRTFTSRCYKHDICYTCGVRFGWTRKQCDETFRNELYNVCNNRNHRKRGFFCKNFAANGYYNAVRLAGHRYWVKNSPPWCIESDVKTCGDPNIPLR
ncbi:hypothetical protein ABFA07_006140 [Porites harrisoni]